MISEAWAQGAAATNSAPAIMNFLPLLVIFGVFYFLIIRPQQQKAGEHQAMLTNLKRNDDVITAGGLHGKIIQLTDQIVTLEIAPNVRVRIDRPQIATLLSKGASTAETRESKEKDKEK